MPSYKILPTAAKKKKKNTNDTIGCYFNNKGKV